MAEITDLIRSAQAGDADASARLYARMYADLKRIAHGRLYRSGGAPDLDTTELVHESYLRLAERGDIDVSDRQAYFGYVGRVMRSALVDHIREQQAARRGGDDIVITLDTGVADEMIDDQRLLAIDDALGALERIAPSYRELVELRYFVGLPMREIAELRGHSTRTVEREWEKARAFLQTLMGES
jgi:RNA polymerase sigma factor (TIGR02999 family)